MQDSFGDYKVLERVGAGTKSEVFRARDTRAGRTAAVKVLTSDLAMDPVVGAPFVDEAYLAQKLGHPSSATLYDIGEQDGRPHLVYEFIQGQTITALLAGHPINPRRALELATQIADALAEAHALGLVHRALRSDKVIVSLKGNAKVLDFGLGHYAAAVHRQMYAAGGAGAAAALRAMAYWAPEQHTQPADARSDVYALGLILLEMLTGRPPATNASAPEISAAPPAIQPLLTRVLAADPALRLDSAATLAAELRQLTTQLESQRDAVVTPPPAAATPAAAPAGRSTAAVAAERSAASTASTAASPATAAAPTPAAGKALRPSTTVAPAAPAGKKASGVTVTSTPPSPAGATTAASATVSTGKKGAAKGTKARTAPAARPQPPLKTSAASAPRPGAPAPQTIDVSGLGTTTIVIAVAVLALLAVLYFVFK